MNKHSVGIDTSNYTTSAARYDGERVLENRKLLLPVKPGEKGLRQSDAVFHHVKQLPQVLEPILEMGPAGVVGVSITPRSEIGSYMPCFLVGKGFACTLGAAWGVGVKFFSHQQGHIAAALYSAGKLELLDRKFLAFHVSGGTTEALLVRPDPQGMPEVELVAQSLDLKAGQAVDRVGVMLGMGFPCGPELERAALAWDGPVKARAYMKGRDCSLSGVENQCRKLWEEGHPREEVARTCLEMVLAALDAMCAGLLEDFGPLPVVFSGGVCSNSILRERLTEKYGGAFAAPEFSADNGAGAAILAWRRRFLP